MVVRCLKAVELGVLGPATTTEKTLLVLQCVWKVVSAHQARWSIMKAVYPQKTALRSCQMVRDAELYRPSSSHTLGPALIVYWFK